MVIDSKLKAVFDRIENRTPEEQAEMDEEFNQKSKDNQLAQLRNDALGFVATRQEEHATESIVREILAEQNIYTTRDDIKAEIWIYNDGIYKPNGESYIKEFVRKVLMYAYTPQRVNKVIAKVEADTMIDTDKFFSSMYLNEICVENGILNLNTRELSEFNPEKIFFNKLPITYDPKAECPNIDSFFEEVLKEKEDKKILYELTGFCLHKDYFIEKAFMFLGSGRNGKGKTLSLLKTFLGSDNTCSVRLSQMEPQSSALCELHNRLVNLAGDLNNTSLKDTGFFKELTGRDYVQVKRKYLRDLIFTNYAKMVFACNELPRVFDLSEGFWSRWVLLEFPYKFLPAEEIAQRNEREREICKVQNPTILDNLTTPSELSGLLNEALDGLDRLKKNKDFSYTKGTATIKDFWIRNSDSFTAFCLDELEGDFENYISKKNLRMAFNKYCKEHKVKGTGDKNMKAVLQDVFGVVESRKAKLDGDFVWEGINFKRKIKESKTDCKGCKGFSTTLGNGNYSTSGKTLTTLTIKENKEDKKSQFTKEEIKKAGYTSEELKEMQETIKNEE